MKYYVVYTGISYPEGATAKDLPTVQKYFDEIEREQAVESILAFAEEIRSRRGLSQVFVENIVNLQDTDVRFASLEALLQEYMLVNGPLARNKKETPEPVRAPTPGSKVSIDPHETASLLRRLADSLEEQGVLIESVETENLPIVVNGPEGTDPQVKDSGQRRLTLVWTEPVEDAVKPHSS